jgi:hypothetical protein
MDKHEVKKSRGQEVRMNLRETVDKYLVLAGDFDRAVPLAAFGFSREETERHFSTLDEDYHISRYFHLSNQAASTPEAAMYQINGFGHTHITIDAEIAEIL